MSDKPLGTCKVWYIIGKNNWYDWILYVLHDLNYCHLKGYPDRKFVYTKDDFISSSSDFMNQSVYEAYHQSNFSYNRTLLDLAQHLSSKDLVKSGYVNINNMSNFRYLYEMLSSDSGNFKSNNKE